MLDKYKWANKAQGSQHPDDLYLYAWVVGFGRHKPVMIIQSLIDTPFGNAEAFNDFLFANSSFHSAAATKLEGMGKSIDAYPLNEIGNVKDWMLIHYQTHQQEFAQLGLVGLPDLSEFDLSDEQQYNDFMLAHYAAHQAVNAVLGL